MAKAQKAVKAVKVPKAERKAEKVEMKDGAQKVVKDSSTIKEELMLEQHLTQEEDVAFHLPTKLMMIRVAHGLVQSVDLWIQ